MMIAIPSGPSDSNYQMEFPKTQIELCQFSRGRTSYVIFQKFLDLVLGKSADGLNLKCPTIIVRWSEGFKKSHNLIQFKYFFREFSG